MTLRSFEIVRRLAALGSFALAALACSATGDDPAPRVETGKPDAGLGIDGGCEDDGCASAACLDAEAKHTSVGCEYFAVDMDGLFGADNGCFVSFVANTSKDFARLTVRFGDEKLDLAQFAKIPSGSGKSLVYAPYDPNVGIPPSQVAILFLAGGYDPDTASKINPWKPVKCPMPTAIPAGAQFHGTGIGQAFRIRSDVPVVAYQMLPYGAGGAAVTGATLLTPTSAWDTNYIAVNAYGSDKDAFGRGPSMNLVAQRDGTSITMVPKVQISPNGPVPGGPANQPVTFKLDAGQALQITQGSELTGSPIQADKPIGMWAGHQCNNVPATGDCCCDHSEQQIPAIRSLGSEYAAVTYRQRTSTPENPPWRIIGAVDGTQLTYEPDVGGPKTLALGEVVEFKTGKPFVVRSQDASHPFVLLGYMTGAATVGGANEAGYGDPDFVRSVPPAQYLDHYVFFTDPTYAETDLVVVRKKGEAGFSAVTLDCAGELEGWKPLGSSGQYEYTRKDLVRHDFEPQGSCDNGRREMFSDGVFGVWVWGWGGPDSQPSGECLDSNPGYSCYVSYGYPAGEGLAQINDVVVPPIPK